LENSISSWYLIGAISISLCLLLVHIIRLTKHYRWEKQSRALSYSLTKNEKLRDSRTVLVRAFKINTRDEKKIPWSEIKSAQDHITSIETCITDILGHWENMALAIDKKIVDDHVAFEMTASVVITYAYMFQEYIQERRVNNERAYKYLQKVVTKWQNKLEDGEIAKSYEIIFDK
jgi:hypothetical protein